MLLAHAIYDKQHQGAIWYSDIALVHVNGKEKRQKYRKTKKSEEKHSLMLTLELTLIIAAIVALILFYVVVAILAMFYLQKNCDITEKGLLVQVRFSMKCDSIANYKTHESELSQQCDLNKSHQVLV